MHGKHNRPNILFIFKLFANPHFYVFTEKKFNKRFFSNDTRDHLLLSIGGYEAYTNDTPMCASKFNDTNGIKVRYFYGILLQLRLYS